MQQKTQVQPQPSLQPQHQPFCTRRLVIGIVGLFGCLLIHLIIGSLYQWGIINIYITSYYHLLDPSTTLENNAITFPIMMLCIGLTMRLGIMLADLTSPILTMGLSVLGQAGIVFASSFVPSMGGFIAVYGVMFGLFSGINFMVPVVVSNKYFPGKKMYVNGIILTGTGLGAVVFGLFSYNFLNPTKLPPNKGYYAGSAELEAIAEKVPECLRWLSLLYLLIGILGVSLSAKMCLEVRKKEKEEKLREEEDRLQHEKVSKQKQSLIKNGKENNKSHMDSSHQMASNTHPQHNVQSIDNLHSSNETFHRQQLDNLKTPTSPLSIPAQPTPYPQTLLQAIRTRICLLSMCITFFGTCGAFLMNGNYKTYVKNTLDNDQLLTVIGVVAALGNGVSRFFWSLLFKYTGY